MKTFAPEEKKYDPKKSAMHDTGSHGDCGQSMGSMADPTPTFKMGRRSSAVTKASDKKEMTFEEKMAKRNQDEKAGLI